MIEQLIIRERVKLSSNVHRIVEAHVSKAQGALAYRGMPLHHAAIQRHMGGAVRSRAARLYGRVERQIGWLNAKGATE